MTRTVAAAADPIFDGVVTNISGTPVRAYHIPKSWEALLDTGLCSLCREVLYSEMFFDEFSSWVIDMMNVMEGIFACFQAGPDYLQARPHLYDDICHLAPILWRCCWSRRDVFVDGNPLERTMPGLAMELRIRLRGMLQSYILAKRVLTDDAESVESSTLRGLYLMCWFYRDEPWNDQLEIQESIVFSDLFDRPDELARFIEQEIVDKYGADSYLTRLGVTMQSVDTSDDYHELFATFIGTQRRILRHDAFRSHFHSTGFPRILCERFRREDGQQFSTLENSSDLNRVYVHALVTQCTLEILSITTMKAPECFPTLLREQNILQLVARAILTLSNPSSQKIDAQSVLDICKSYELVGKDLSARSNKNPLRKEYKRGLRREWYPLLQSLDQLIKQQRATAKSVVTRLQVRMAWCRVGTIGMGLDEDEERKDYEKRATKLCSWRECQWHIVEPPEPPRACTGCGETRYCSKSCQTRDWKSGHKQMCRRLKQTPHIQA
ncbi:hypothetical protein PENSPDRAFT_760082 [Peniophora sp. CONT]|nr:hypothetical protein PENSPDRAFT_760082 [Peniophora sp. CONT]